MVATAVAGMVAVETAVVETAAVGSVVAVRAGAGSAGVAGTVAVVMVVARVVMADAVGYRQAIGCAVRCIG